MVFVYINNVKTKCVFTAHKQNAEKNYNAKLAHVAVENVVKSIYFGMIQANKSFNEEHKSGC
jgi:hypothetical protein